MRTAWADNHPHRIRTVEPILQCAAWSESGSALASHAALLASLIGLIVAIPVSLGDFPPNER